jgi:transposase-like protein
MDEEKKLGKWQALSGEQRYRVVELARKGVEIAELCRTFGVSRQTFYRALEAADRASVEALSPKPPGRKPKPESERKLSKVRSEKAELERKLKKMRQRYEVAQALLELQRKLDRGEPLPGEKKASRKNRRSNPKSASSTGTTTPLADGHDGGGAGHESSESSALDPPERG